MTVSHEESLEVVLAYVKGSWDKNISEESRSVFLALAIPGKQVSVNSLTYDTRINFNKIAISLSALEALQLISQTKSGVSKFCELTEFGWLFSDKFDLKGENK